MFTLSARFDGIDRVRARRNGGKRSVKISENSGPIGCLEITKDEMEKHDECDERRKLQ